MHARTQRASLGDNAAKASRPFKSKPIAATKRWFDAFWATPRFLRSCVLALSPSCIDRGVGSGGDGLGGGSGGSAGNGSGCQ